MYRHSLVASLKGDREEALKNIKEAIELYLEVLKEDGKPIPQDVGEEVLLDA